MEKELWYKRNKRTTDSANKWKFHLWKFVDAYFFKTSLNCLSCWRIFLLKLFGAKIGKGCYISPRVTITRPWEFEMGNISSIDDCCYIIPPVKIGDYVSIGNNTHIIAGGHDLWSRGFEVELSTIKIGNGAFIGADVFISQGCEIGQMTIIGAKTHIISNIPENTIVVSRPSKYIKCRRLTEEEYKKYRYHYIKP